MEITQLEPIINWLAHHQTLLLLSIGVIAFLESFAIAGFLIPGVAIMIGLAAAAASVDAALLWVLLSGWVGAVLGDGISFILGRKYRDQILSIYPLNRNPQWITHGQFFFQKYGILSIIIGRFIGPLRAFIPFIAGSMQMRPTLFFTINILSATAWSPFYLIPGYAVGLSMQENSFIDFRHIAVLAALVAMAAFLSWLRVKIKNWPNISYFTFYSCLALFWVLAWLASSEPKFALDQWMHEFFVDLRNPWLDPVMVYMTGIGYYIPTAFFAVSFTVWLASQKAYRSALVFFLLMSVCPYLIFPIKEFFAYARPLAVIQPPSSAAFPSGHAIVSCFLFGYSAWFLSLNQNSRVQFRIWLAAITCILLISVSRLYLGVHWLSDILSGWALAICVLQLSIGLHKILSKYVSEKPVPLLRSLLVLIIILTTDYLIVVKDRFPSDTQKYKKISNATLRSAQEPDQTGFAFHN